MRGYRKKVLSFFIAFMMLLSMVISAPFTVRAEGAVTWNDLTLNDGMILDLSNFNDTDAGGKTITVVGGTVTIKGVANKTFKNLSIIIKNGSIVTIENLNITNDVFNRSPIIADDGSDNKLIISGTNNIRASVDDKSGISVEGSVSVEDSAKLFITSTDTNAKLNVYGGNNGAGIGGGKDKNGGIITIDENAKVTATGGGGYCAAGIGGGSGGSGGIIKIEGNAEVTAIGGEGFGAAGIGGGSGGSGGTITIGKDANITAIRKGSPSSAINVTTILSSQPIISGKLGAALSNTSDTNIQIINTSNNLSTKSFMLPASAYSFSSTVGGQGEYTIDAGDKSLVKSGALGAPVDGIYNLSSSQEYDMTTGYKVTFDSQGGTPTFQYGFVASGDKVSVPANEPTKDGHVFEGWYNDSNCISKWDFNNNVNTNTTLYAKYPSAASGIMVSTTTKIPAETGKVMLTVIPEPSDANHKIYYRVVDTKPTKMYVGDLITVGEWTEVTDTSPFEINAEDGKYVEVVEINVVYNKVTKWGRSSEINDGYTPSYEMRLSETGTLTITFPDQAEGYSQVTPKSITITKTGNEDITNLTATLSGADKDSFTLVNLSGATLNNAITEVTLTVQPKNGLSEGNYTAIVNISGDRIESHSINMSFKVRLWETTKSETTTPAAVTIEGIERVGETLEAVLLTDSRAKFTTSQGVTYEWYRLSDKDSNSGELVGYDKTYKLVGIDKGRYMKVIADYNGETFEAFTGNIDSSSSSSSNSSSSSHKRNSHKKTSDTNKCSSTGKAEDTSIQVKMADGWQKQSNNTWMYGENGKAVVQWKKINGLWYYFDFNGIMQIYWKFIDGNWYFFNSNGVMMTDWALVNGKWYYLTLSGAMATGWINLYGKWYYLNPSGDMETCWINLNGKWYYLYGDGSLAVSTVLNYRVDENGVWVE